MHAPNRPFFILTLLCVLLFACREKDADPSQQPQAPRHSAPRQLTIAKEGCELRYTRPPATTSLNDPFEISLDALCDKPADVSVGTAKLEAAFLPALKAETPETDGERPFQQHFSLTLEPLWHGTVTIPEILVSFSFKDSSPVIVAIPEMTISVAPPTEAEQAGAIDDSAALAPLSATPPSHAPALAIALGACLLAVALFLIFLRSRRRHAASAPGSATPRIPPHIAALEQLDALLALKLIQQGLTVQFYNRISEILRDYIEARFNIRAPERTTEEFLDELRNSPNAFSPRHTALLNNFLRHTDLVKYARVTPRQDEIDQTVADTASFIRETIPEEQP